MIEYRGSVQPRESYSIKVYRESGLDSEYLEVACMMTTSTLAATLKGSKEKVRGELQSERGKTSL